MERIIELFELELTSEEYQTIRNVFSSHCKSKWEITHWSSIQKLRNYFSSAKLRE